MLTPLPPRQRPLCGSAAQIAVKPPSAATTAPVTKLERGETRSRALRRSPRAGPPGRAAGRRRRTRRPPGVDRHHGVPVLRRRLRDRLVEGAPGVVDQDVRAAEGIDGCPHRAVGGRLLRDVGDQGASRPPREAAVAGRVVCARASRMSVVAPSPASTPPTMTAMAGTYPAGRRWVRRHQTASCDERGHRDGHRQREHQPPGDLGEHTAEHQATDESAGTRGGVPAQGSAALGALRPVGGDQGQCRRGEEPGGHPLDQPGHDERPATGSDRPRHADHREHTDGRQEGAQAAEQVGRPAAQQQETARQEPGRSRYSTRCSW